MGLCVCSWYQIWKVWRLPFTWVFYLVKRKETLPILKLTLVIIKSLFKEPNGQVKGYVWYKTIFCHKVALNAQLMIFLFKKQWCFVFETSRFFCFCEIHRFQNLWCHHKHCYVIKVTLNSFNPKNYQNEIRSGTSVLYDNHFKNFIFFSWMLETGN